MTLTVMSQNAQYGAHQDGRWDGMLDVIRSVDPQLLLLQEVDWLADPQHPVPPARARAGGRAGGGFCG